VSILDTIGGYGERLSYDQGGRDLRRHLNRGNMGVALRVVQPQGPGHAVVTVPVDAGMKYSSTELFYDM
jgi:hypothetical protein